MEKKRFMQKMEFECGSELLMVGDPIILWPPFLQDNSELELRRSLPGLDKGSTLRVPQFSQLLLLPNT